MLYFPSNSIIIFNLWQMKETVYYSRNTFLSFTTSKYSLYIRKKKGVEDSTSWAMSHFLSNSSHSLLYAIKTNQSSKGTCMINLVLERRWQKWSKKKEKKKREITT